MNKAKKGGASPWGRVAGWKAAEIADTFLLGAEEGGFMGLEVLDDPKILQSMGIGQQDGENAGGPAGENGGNQKKQKTKKKKQTRQEVDGNGAHVLQEGSKKKQKDMKRARGQGDEGGDAEQENGEEAAPKKQKAGKKKRKKTKDGAEGGVEALLARVRELERENKALKATRGPSEAPADTSSPPVPHPGALPPPSAPSLTQPPLADVSAWQPYMLHPTVLNALGRLGFSEPTEIQQACLPAAIRDRRDIIGAAQTGSGKTLAFALPILHWLAEEREERNIGTEEEKPVKYQGPLRALILAPTRELALQVCSHMQAIGRICRVRCEAIVGGLAAVKQERLLRACPPVIVGTPGRLWELMSAGDAHLCDLKQLRFFVLDEADRMVQQGHFQELTHILGLLPRPTKEDAEEEDADIKPTRSMKRVSRLLNRKKHGSGDNPMEKKEKNAAGMQQDGDEKEGRAGSDPEEEEKGPENLHGRKKHRKGEKSVADSNGDEHKTTTASDEDMSEGEESDEDEDNHNKEHEVADGRENGVKSSSRAAVAASDDGEEGGSQGGGGAHGEGEGERVRYKRHMMQTFVFSATLTLPSKLRKRMKKNLGGAAGSASLESLMDRITFRGRPAVVDLTPMNKLAEGVQEAQINCLEDEREHLLYYLLACHPGRTIVFANAVSAIRRLSAVLKTLGLPASALHAQQQQRQRLKALDNFRKREDSILVATDVAARGLDVKDVSTVVHFQLPPSVDTYIHRCGRTGRMRTDGVSIAIVTPKESPRFALLCQSLGRPAPPVFPVDPPVLAQALRRWKLALKIDSIEHQLKKWNADKSWAERTAAMVGLDVSDDALGPDSQVDDDKIKGLERRATAIRTGQLSPAAAKQLRAELAHLLAKPLQPYISRSFFTGGASLSSLASAKSAQAKQSSTGTPSGHAKQAALQPTDDEAVQNAADNVTEAAAPAEVMNSAMTRTLTLAKHLASATQASKKGKLGQTKVNGPSKLSKKQAKLARQDPQAARLALARSMLKKKQGRKQNQSKLHGKGMVVIAESIARNLHGPNAVQVLKQQLGKT